MGKFLIHRENREHALARYQTPSGGNKDNFFLGTKVGICPLCGKFKTLLLCMEGIIVCEDCLDILASMLKAECKLTSKGKLIERINGLRLKPLRR